MTSRILFTSSISRRQDAERDLTNQLSSRRSNAVFTDVVCKASEVADSLSVLRYSLVEDALLFYFSICIREQRFATMQNTKGEIQARQKK